MKTSDESKTITLTVKVSLETKYVLEYLQAKNSKKMSSMLRGWIEEGMWKEMAGK